MVLYRGAHHVFTYTSFKSGIVATGFGSVIFWRKIPNETFLDGEVLFFSSAVFLDGEVLFFFFPSAVFGLDELTEELDAVAVDVFLVAVFVPFFSKKIK